LISNAYLLMSTLARLVPGTHGRTLRRHFRDLAWLRQADVAFVSFPKSGRTYVRAMLARLYQRQFGIDERELLEFESLQDAPSGVPRVLFTHDGDPMRGPDEISIEERAYSGRKVVLLARHPGDTAISRYHHLKHRSRDRARRNLADQPIDDFVWTTHGGIPSIVAFLNAWSALARRRSSILILRYEDFLARPQATLKQLADFIGLDASAAEIDEAVDFARIDNLKAKEREGYFSSERLQVREGRDALSGKVRTGKAGGFRTSLSGENVRRIDDYVARHLDPAFGYARR
jgi:hypothetical protein